MVEIRLDGKVAVITGASRGLGKAMALALAESGVNLALAARDLEALKQTASEATKLGVEAEVYKTDVTDEAQVIALAEAVRERFGKVNILINNAGMNLRQNITEFTLEQWNLVQATNVTSAFLMSRAFVPLMRGNGWGRIINMTSIVSHIALPGRTAYASTKAGLLGFTRALGLELVPDNISVVGISPGVFGTEMNRPIMEDPEKNQFFMDRVPAGHWGKVEDIGTLAKFLCAEETAYITASDIIIDGGWTAQ